METFNEFDTKGTIPERTTSAIISHAFETYKVVFGYAILALVLYMIASMIITPLSGYDQSKVIEEIQSNPGNIGISTYTSAPGFYSYSLLNFIFGIVMTPLFVGIIYMAHKANTKQTINFADLFYAYKNNFVNIVIYAIITNIILTIALMLCVLPVFFVLPLLFIGYPILLFENASAVDALTKSFNIAKENYGTFLGVALLSILIAISGIILCFIGIIATALFYMAASYSLYIAYAGLPKQISHNP